MAPWWHQHDSNTSPAEARNTSTDGGSATWKAMGSAENQWSTVDSSYVSWRASRFNVGWIVLIDTDSTCALIFEEYVECSVRSWGVTGVTGVNFGELKAGKTGGQLAASRVSKSPNLVAATSGHNQVMLEVIPMTIGSNLTFSFGLKIHLIYVAMCHHLGKRIWVYN